MAFAGPDGTSKSPPLTFLDVPELPLKNIKLGVFSAVDGLRLCMDALSAFPYASLTSIYITSQVKNHGIENTAIVSHIAPLLRLSHMRRIELVLLNQIFHLTDEHLLQMGTSWPQIVCLAVLFRTSKRGRRLAPELHTVRGLLSRCPRLHELALPALKISDVALHLPEPDQPPLALKFLRIHRMVRSNLPPEVISRTVLAILGPGLRLIDGLNQ